MEENVDSGSSQAKFAIHPTYRLAFCMDISSPEEYFAQQNMLMLMLESLDKFIKVHENYQYLRNIDINKMVTGDEIMVLDINKKRDTDKNNTDIDSSKKLFIKEILNNSYEVIDSENNVYIVEKFNVRPLDEYLNKIKIDHLITLYNHMFNDLIINDCACIEFFYIFTEYFQIESKKLYHHLSKDHQLCLLNYLDERVHNVKYMTYEKYNW